MAYYSERYWLSSLVVWQVTRGIPLPSRSNEVKRRTRYGKAYKSNKPMYYKTFYKMRQSEPQWQIDCTKQVWEYSGEDDVFGEKVRLVSPFAAAEVLVSVLRH